MLDNTNMGGGDGRPKYSDMLQGGGGVEETTGISD